MAKRKAAVVEEASVEEIVEEVEPVVEEVQEVEVKEEVITNIKKPEVKPEPGIVEPADDDKLKQITYVAYTLGVNMGYTNPSREEYKKILIDMDVIDTTTQEAVFKKLSV